LIANLRPATIVAVNVSKEENRHFSDATTDS
jgi:hypothetical protein